MDMKEYEQEQKRMQRALIATIKAKRSARGWTQEDLGKRAGINHQQIGRWERGEREPRSFDLAAIAKAFGGMSLSQFWAAVEEQAAELDKEDASDELAEKRRRATAQ